MKKTFIALLLISFTAFAFLGCGTTASTTMFDQSKAITDNTVLAAHYVEVDGNGSMITAIQNDIYGIGYIALSSLANSGLHAVSFGGVEATKANVLNETYASIKERSRSEKI